MIEIHQLRCFVAVAEELSFSRAAARLHMTQPPLSRQIQLLERLLSCELFFRTSRSVQLTLAGASFLPEAKRVLRVLGDAAAMVQDVAAGKRGLLRCGFTAASAFEFLPSLISVLSREHGDIMLSLKEMVSRRQVEALLAGELDIGILRPPIDPTQFDFLLVAEEPLVVALPEHHPLARRDALRWGDLSESSLIGYEPVEGQYLHDLVSSLLLRNAVSVNVAHKLSQIHSILALVRAGAGIALVPCSTTTIDMSGVVYRRISGKQQAAAKLYVAWRKNDASPLVDMIRSTSQRTVAGEIETSHAQ